MVPRFCDVVKKAAELEMRLWAGPPGRGGANWEREGEKSPRSIKCVDRDGYPLLLDREDPDSRKTPLVATPKRD